jgi:hypothetical protein
MELEGSLPWAQNPTIASCPESVQSSQDPHTSLYNAYFITAALMYTNVYRSRLLSRGLPTKTLQAFLTFRIQATYLCLACLKIQWYLAKRPFSWFLPTTQNLLCIYCFSREVFLSLLSLFGRNTNPLLCLLSPSILINIIKSSRATSRVKCLNDENISVSKTISVLETLVFSPLNHLTRLVARKDFIVHSRRESSRSYDLTFSSILCLLPSQWQIAVFNRTARCAVLCFVFWETTGSCLFPETAGIMTKISRQMPEWHLELGHDRFLPHPFQLTINNHPSIQCYVT